MRTCLPRRSKFPEKVISFCLIVLSIPFASAQTVPTATTGPVATSGTSNVVSSQLQTFQAERQALAGEVQNLIAQGATSDQIQAWHQQNQARITAQQKLAQAISASQPAQPIGYITDVNVPAGASQTMEDFLTARADLFNLRAQLHNQQLQSSGTVDEAQVNAAFQQQNATVLQAQVQRAQVVAAESDQQTQPTPPPLVVPAGATPQVAAFLTLRDQLMRDFIQLHNQNIASTPAVREAALQQWSQQNAGRIQQLRQQAQNLSAASSTSAN